MQTQWKPFSSIVSHNLKFVDYVVGSCDAQSSDLSCVERLKKSHFAVECLFRNEADAFGCHNGEEFTSERGFLLK